MSDERKIYPLSRWASPTDFLDRLMSNLGENYTSNGAVRRHEKEDRTVLEFNLAGFEADEITVHVDTALHKLVVTALRDTSEEKKVSETNISLNPHVDASKITSEYRTGLLQVTIPNDSRQEREYKVDVPVKVNSGSEKLVKSDTQPQSDPATDQVP